MKFLLLILHLFLIFFFCKPGVLNKKRCLKKIFAKISKYFFQPNEGLEPSASRLEVLRSIQLSQLGKKQKRDLDDFLFGGCVLHAVGFEPTHH
jgi:hypothetical protein